MNHYKKYLIALGLVSFSSFSLAAVDFHIGGGPSRFNTSDGSIRVTSSETDTLVANNSWGGGIGNIGVGIGSPFSNVTNPLIQSLKFEVNGYYVENDVKGPIYRFGDPAFHDYDYKASVRSTRLMVDGLFNVLNFGQASLFVKGGIGGALNSTNYKETALGGGACNGTTISLSRSDELQFAAEAGAGVQFNFSQSFGVSLQYLYAHLGDAESGLGATAGCLGAVSPSSFHLNNESVLLSLHYLFA